MGSRAAAQALAPGRVVLMADSSSGLAELGVICGAVPAAKTGIQLGNSSAAGDALNHNDGPHLVSLLDCRVDTDHPCCAGAAGKHYYVVSMHAPSPADAQEEAANRLPAAAAASDRALPGSFQAPAGFVLKGAACHQSSRDLSLVVFKVPPLSPRHCASQGTPCLLLTLSSTVPSGLHRTIEGCLVAAIMIEASSGYQCLSQCPMTITMLNTP